MPYLVCGKWKVAATSFTRVGLTPEVPAARTAVAASGVVPLRFGKPKWGLPNSLRMPLVPCPPCQNRVRPHQCPRPCGVGSVIRNTDRGPQALLLGSGRQCTINYKYIYSSASGSGAAGPGAMRRVEAKNRVVAGGCSWTGGSDAKLGVDRPCLNRSGCQLCSRRKHQGGPVFWGPMDSAGEQGAAGAALLLSCFVWHRRLRKRRRRPFVLRSCRSTTTLSSSCVKPRCAARCWEHMPTPRCGCHAVLGVW